MSREAIIYYLKDLLYLCATLELTKHCEWALERSAEIHALLDELEGYEDELEEDDE